MRAKPQQIKSAYQQFTEYVEHGFVLVPINGVAKGPSGEYAIDWNLRENCISAVADIPQWMTQGGLAHLYSGTASFDIDNLELARPHFKEHGINIDEYLNEKNAVRLESGRKNRSKLIYKVSKKLAKKLIHINRQDLGYELRCRNAKGRTVQDVLPPSIHPGTTKPFYWEGDWRNLPRLPKKLEKYWLKALERKAANTPVNDLFTIALPLLDSALEVIDPDCDYGTWLEIGMALHSAGHSDKWPEWSSKGNKYKPGECEKLLDGFDAEGGITLATLFHHAREAGWVCDELMPFAQNDLGNAQRLALQVADRIRHIADLDVDYVWTDQGWIENDGNELHCDFKKVIGSLFSEARMLPEGKKRIVMLRHATNSGNAARIKAAIELVRHEYPIRTVSSQWDSNGNLIAFEDGQVLDIQTMESRPMRQADLIRRRVNAPLDLGATCPEFLYLIDHIVDGNENTRDWLLQLWSTGLSGKILLKIILVLWGASDSGKTTVVEVLKRVLGEYACSLQHDFIIKSKYATSANSPNAEVIHLQGRRAIFIAEFPKARLDENKIKILTGGDTLEVRPLHSNKFVKVQCRLTMTIASNPKPSFDATDVGLLRRIRALHVRKPLNFAKKPERSNAADWIFERERAGVAALLIYSLRDLMDAKNELPESRRIKNDTAELNLANDRVQQFIEQRCIRGAKCEQSKSTLYIAYTKFCDDEGGKPFGAPRFHEVMREVHGFREKKVRGDRRYVGIEEVAL